MGTSWRSWIADSAAPDLQLIASRISTSRGGSELGQSHASERLVGSTERRHCPDGPCIRKSGLPRSASKVGAGTSGEHSVHEQLVQHFHMSGGRALPRADSWLLPSRYPDASTEVALWTGRLDGRTHSSRAVPTFSQAIHAYSTSHSPVRHCSMRTRPPLRCARSRRSSDQVVRHGAASGGRSASSSAARGRDDASDDCGVVALPTCTNARPVGLTGSYASEERSASCTSRGGLRDALADDPLRLALRSSGTSGSFVSATAQDTRK